MKFILNSTFFKKLTFGLITILLASFLASIFIIFPAIVLDKIIKTADYILPLTIFKQLIIFVFFLLFPLLFKKTRLKSISFATIASGYYSIIYFLIAFWYLTHNDFSPYYFADSYYAIIPTGILIFGKFLMIMLFLSLIALFLIFYYLFITLHNALFNYINNTQIKFFNFKYLLIAIIPICLLPVIPPYRGYITYNYHIISESQKARKIIQPIIPEYSPNLENAADNIFILQMESINALTLQGQTEIGGTKYPELYIPQLYQIAKDGIFFPYFWSNSMQTDRAQENILCGIAGNIGQGFSYRSGINLQSCLPHKLNQAGYKTIVFRSDDLDFNNMGNFMNYLGFEDIHYDDIMQPEDVKYKWGYDDCVYYQRVFEYLKKNHPNPSKLLVYLEVSSTHIPWENKNQYKFADKIEQPQTYAENYINAQSEQDYCLSKFYEEYKNYNPPQTHLFILSDTSCPLGINNGDIFNFQNNYNENFITLMLYIPPAGNKSEYQINKVVANSLYYSHNDILPTINELLSGQIFPNSFVYELKKDQGLNNHDDCQIISQPYSGSYIIVIDKDEKYIYSSVDKTVVHSNIKMDLWEKNPVIIENNLSFVGFKEKYFCERYK